MISYKTTKKLYRGRYQYSIVLVSRYCDWFRSKGFDRLLACYPNAKNSNDPELRYAEKLCRALSRITDYDIRVSSPTIRIYTSDYSVIEMLRDINEMPVDCIYIPSCELKENEVYMPTMNFDYRITLGSNKRSTYHSFLDWAKLNSKVQISDNARFQLCHPYTNARGGGIVYVKGDNMLLCTKMHLGGIKLKIERIVH